MGRLVLDYIRTLEWPVLIAAVAWWFRREIVAVLRRELPKKIETLVEVSFMGATVKWDAAEQAQNARAALAVGSVVDSDEAAASEAGQPPEMAQSDTVQRILRASRLGVWARVPAPAAVDLAWTRLVRSADSIARDLGVELNPDTGAPLSTAVALGIATLSKDAERKTLASEMTLIKDAAKVELLYRGIKGLETVDTQTAEDFLVSSDYLLMRIDAMASRVTVILAGRGRHIDD